MGGKEKFVERLDFALKTNLIDYGNEPSFLALRSFSHVGRPDLTSYWAHYALNKNFDLTGGLDNDDSGAMSSWYIFSALGFSPNAGQDIYYLNAPLYPKSVITLGNGMKLTILAENTSEKTSISNHAKSTVRSGTIPSSHTVTLPMVELLNWF